VVTLAGIALVVSEKGAAMSAHGHRRRTLGVLLALGGAMGQATGFVFSKLGLAGGFSPVSANLIRVCAGILALGAYQVVRGRLVPNVRNLRDGRAVWLIVGGALSGPVTGVVLSLYAIGHARYLGVASTLMSLSPVILLPVSVILEKEHVGRRAVLGTLISISGAAGLFLL
jgi:drug/metabolite transporter (DMT)-like permease